VSAKNAAFWDVTLLALVRADVSEETMASISRMERSSDVGTT
jgi:hypothetical protein